MAVPSYGPLLDAVRGVHWRARRPVGAGLAGTHQSRMRGTSAEFTEYRLYRQGDDPRKLDWRLLARSDRPYIRLATDRAVLPTTIAVDRSASMAYPPGSLAKWTRACELAVGLAAVAHADGDPIGLVVPKEGGGAIGVPPRMRRGVVAEVARLLGDVPPDGSAPLAPVVASQGAARWAIITDLLGDADDLLRVARVHLAAGGEVHLVHVIAAEELDPASAAMLAVDPENAGIERLLADDTRAAYTTRFAAWRAEQARAWRDSGAAYTEVTTDEPADRAVRRIAERPTVLARGA